MRDTACPLQRRSQKPNLGTAEGSIRAQAHSGSRQVTFRHGHVFAAHSWGGGDARDGPGIASVKTHGFGFGSLSAKATVRTFWKPGLQQTSFCPSLACMSSCSCDEHGCPELLFQIPGVAVHPKSLPGTPQERRQVGAGPGRTCLLGVCSPGQHSRLCHGEHKANGLGGHCCPRPWGQQEAGAGLRRAASGLGPWWAPRRL